MIQWLVAAAAGAAAMFFLDPDRGRRRRVMARDRAARAARRTRLGAVRLRRKALSGAYGASQKAAHPEASQEPPPNDATLTAKVQSELFSDPSIPKGRVSVNSEQGVVQLRGQVERPEMIREIEDRVRSIPGVGDVENLLHLPGTPAPSS